MPRRTPTPPRTTTSRVFAYARVSTLEQTTDNQVQEIEAAGFHIEPRRLIVESVSGSSAIEQRSGFMKLLDRMEPGDVLVVTKLDRLGRNSIDIQMTVQMLADRGIRVHCLALGGTDLTSSAGRMIMTVIAAFAQFERDLLIERTHAGLARARAAGKVSGRPPTLTPEQRAQARELLDQGRTVSEVARLMNTTRQTILRARDETAPEPRRKALNGSPAGVAQTHVPPGRRRRAPQGEALTGN
jgi:putative DNA-invertase from lambdoid prophage Rac